MSRFNSPVNNIRIAAPCAADWDRMIGNDRTRFCAQCNLNVYNLSGMTRTEAETLIAQSEGRLCVRFYRRRDGSILTENCPVGLRALRRRLSAVARAAASAVLSFLVGVGLYETEKDVHSGSRTMGAVVVRPEDDLRTIDVTVRDTKASPLPPVVGQAWIQGDLNSPAEKGPRVLQINRKRNPPNKVIRD